MLLPYDNATSRRHHNPRNQLHRTAVEHPPCNPNLSPCDYHLFAPLKEALREQFDNNDGKIRTQTASNMSHYFL